MEEHAGYHSYLLRLWLTREGDGPIWRASLESPSTGERLGFPDLEHLYSFLSDLLAKETSNSHPKQSFM